MVPYFYDPNLDEQNKDASTVSISGASPTYDESGASEKPSNNNQGLNTGSGYQNLDKYLKTNNAEAFGQKLQGKVSDQVQNAQTQMTQASDQFKNQVDTLNKVPTTNQVNQAIANPGQADAKEFQNWENQSYAGANSLAGNQDAWNKYWSGVNQAQTNTKLLGTEPGRFTLLDQYFGKPSYNFGEKSLDNLLYQESGLGSQTKALQDQASQLKTQGDTDALKLSDYASTKAGQVNDSRNSVLNAIGLNADKSVKTGDDAGAIGQQWAQAQADLAAQNAQRQSNIRGVTQDLDANQLKSSELAQTGLTANQNIYDLDLRNYLTPGSDLTLDQAMSPDQRAKIQALSQLAGITDTFAANPAQDRGQDYTFDQNRLNADVAARQGAYQDAINQALQTVSQQKGYAVIGGNTAISPETLAYYKTLPGMAEAISNIDKQFKVDRTVGASAYSPLLDKSPSVYGSLPDDPLSPLDSYLAKKPSVYGRLPA